MRAPAQAGGSNPARRAVFRCIYLLFLAFSAPATACQLVQVAKLPVTFLHRMPVVTVNLDNHPVRMLVDTGASVSLLTPEAMRKIHATYTYGTSILMKGANGSSASAATYVQHFQLGGVTVENMPFFVDALQGAGHTELEGSIGEDILGSYNVGLDFPHAELDLYEKNGCSGLPWAGQFAALPMQLARGGAPLIKFFIDDGAFLGLIDTGAGGLFVRAAALARQGVTADQTGGSAHDVGIGGEAGTWQSENFALLTIGGEQFAHPWLAVTAGPASGADAEIGELYLHSHQVFLDFAARQVWLGVTSPASSR